MRFASMRWALASALTIATAIDGLSAAELNSETQKKVDAVHESLLKLPPLVRAKKYDELGTLIDQIEKSVGELKESEDAEAIGPVMHVIEDRLAAAHHALRASLELAAAAKAPPTPKPVMPQPKAAPAGSVSFMGEVAPLLTGRCGRCHGTDNPRANFSVASYAMIIKGSDAGRVFVPGKGNGSTLVELLASGDMPRGGNRLSDDEIQKVTKWIDEGANFDGPDPTAMLLASNTPGGMDGMTVRATGNESVQFMRDVAPIIVGNCIGCHSGDQPSDNFSLETFTRLMRGGQDGAVVNPGNGAGSRIVQMVKGTARQNNQDRPQMPFRRSPLSDADIKTIETWINEGARFDGEDPAQSIDLALRILQARAMSHAELASLRDTTAKRNWKLTMSDVAALESKAGDIRVLGNLPKDEFETAVKLVEAERSKVAGILKLAPGKPLMKGDMTIFLFDKTFEYKEFGRMVEKRDPPADMYGHHGYTVIDAYGAISADSTAEPNMGLLIAEQIAATYVAALGRNVPAWFSVGSGRAVAARVEPRAPWVKDWDQSVGVAAATSGSAVDFLTARELDARGAALAYGYVKGMMKDTAKYQALLDAVSKGAPFATALQQTYGINIQQMTQQRNRRP